MSSEDRRVLAVAGIAALCCLPLRALGPAAPPLGNAASFAVLGGSSVTNSGPTVVTGNLGVSPGSTITGFPPGVVKLGDTFKNDALAKVAHNDAGIAYNQLGSGTCMPLSSLSGSPSPGIYCVPSTAQLTGALTLDAHGNHDAVWIFRVTSTFTTDPGSCVLAINEAQPGNVFWQVGSSATLGADSAFVGNLLAHDNITLSSRASAFGRLLALTGTVTLDSNNVTLCSTCNVINLDPPALPDGIVGAHYSQTISAYGGTAPYTYKVISGALPKGLGPLTTGGVLSGTPMEFGTFPITVAATDSQGCSGERVYTINIACPKLTLWPSALLNGSVNVSYSQQLTASGGTLPYTFTKVSGSLPPGFTPPNPSSGGLLSGTPTAAGVYHFRVMATDSNGCSGTIDYTLFICPLTISPPTFPSGTVGTRYNQPITANDGSGSYTFSVPANTLPPGLELPNRAARLPAAISGTPTTSGSFTFTVTAVDMVSGCVGSRTYTIVVCGLTLSPAILSMATLGVPYNETITASGGTAPYTFSSSGTFPTGLTFMQTTPTTGVISGTPTALGTFTFCITVTDASTPPCTVMVCYPITVAVGSPTLSGWGMLVFGLLLVGAGLIVIRR